MKQSLKRNIKKGFSMIELIIVIAVLGVLTAVVLNQAQGMRESSNLNRESSNLGMLTTAIQSTFNSQGSYAGLANDIITSSTSFPTAMEGASDDDIKTVWSNQGVHVVPAKYNNQNDAGFAIHYVNVPESACMDFVSQNYSSFFRVDVVASSNAAPASNFNNETGSLDSNATVVYSKDPAASKDYGVATAQNACNGGAKSVRFFSR